MPVDLKRELDSLDRVFHSEADFQHELAWRLHQRYEDSTIRLERRLVPPNPPTHLQEMYVDLWIEKNQSKIPIELKYKTDEFSGKINDEVIQLRSQGAHPPNRFDVIADIERIEVLTDTSDVAKGYVAFLTNDSAYWHAPTQNVIDADFRLHDELGGTLSWADRASQQTKTKKRDRSITLQNDYQLNWQQYQYNQPQQDVSGNQEFRYLVIKVE